LRNKDITVYGDGSQTRSFCYVDDLVSGMIKMMEQPDFIGPVNLGNPEEYTVLELAQKIIKMVHSQSKVVFKPLPENDPTRRRPDITLAKEKLNWQPTIPVDQGLEKTIEYFRKVVSRDK
ncbi:MAG: GDP-mannose 4,6-dehydratase, partial [Blastocatellia bacterium]|nr:GDP-mannose 4,6-dehydratase [Blastocatellia bacterium]